MIRSLLIALLLMIVTSIAQADLLKSIQGDSISLVSLKGKWVIINYWADWCQSCIEEIPELNRFYQKHQKDPVVLFAVNYDAPSIKKQKKLIKKLHILYSSLSTDPALVLGLGDIIGIPITFVINPEGTLSSKLYGKQTLTTLEQAIKTP